MNKPEINPVSNHSFSFSREKSRQPNRFKSGFEICAGFDLLERAITKVVWSPSIFWGGNRLEANFAFSDFMALDFDSGPTIRDISEAFRDMSYLIATTRSHNVEKKGVIAERFRLVVPWERRITDLNTFRASITYYMDRYGADQACKDGARFFWPCVEIISKQDPDPDLELATITPYVGPQKYEHRNDPITGERILPNHIQAFLIHGKNFGVGRNISCFITAKELCDGGVSEDDAISIISNAPFDRDGFPDREIISAVKSAYKGKL